MRVERLICVSWIVCCYGVEPFYSRCAMPMLPSSVLLHRLWSSSSIKACPNLSVALTISLAITVSYMECPLSKAIRSSSSFQTWCRSRAVSGGHIASLPPCIAMQGGSGYGCLVVIVIFCVWLHCITVRWFGRRRRQFGRIPRWCRRWRWQWEERFIWMQDVLVIGAIVAC